jgi:ribonuclease HI
VIRANGAIEGEAKGLEAILLNINKLNGQEIIIEMDAYSIVQAVQKKIYPRLYWGKIARRSGEMLTQHPNVSLAWVRRTRNRVANSCGAVWL